MIYTLPGGSTGDRRRRLPALHDVGGRDQEEEVRGDLLVLGSNVAHMRIFFFSSLFVSLSSVVFVVNDVGARLYPSRRPVKLCGCESASGLGIGRQLQLP